MVDMFPFPRIMGKTPEEQIGELTNYLVQFKETLEFALSNISTENLSPELINRLNELGANVSNANKEEELAQIKSREPVTVSDVINSPTFNLAVRDRLTDITFTVNLETGHLEYSILSSEEA